MTRAVRGYPSALNRAGRIYGGDDPDTGLKHLSEAIEQARRLSDGWFWFTSIIEYVELCYRAWERTEDDRYLEWIVGREPDVAQVMTEYEFLTSEAGGACCMGTWGSTNGAEPDKQPLWPKR